MIRNQAPPPQDPAFEDWLVRAKAAREALEKAVLEGKPVEIDESLYKEPKPFLLAAFHGKCAYCEMEITPGQPGDVEHFRPKGRVTGTDGKQVMVQEAGHERPHPGYYWLAYEWSNLLPACIRCNRPTKLHSGERYGKWDRFAVEDESKRAFIPGREKGEVPLLLDPRADDPEEHLVFDFETGVIGFLTPRGEECMRTLGLNREGLVDQRLKACKDLRAHFKLYIQAITRDGNDAEKEAKEYKEQFKEIQEGKAQYAGCIYRLFQRLVANFQERFGLG
jgi:uncharacterized protein (TIGR02646 family)